MPVYMDLRTTMGWTLASFEQFAFGMLLLEERLLLKSRYKKATQNLDLPSAALKRSPNLVFLVTSWGAISSNTGSLTIFLVNDRDLFTCHQLSTAMKMCPLADRGSTICTNKGWTHQGCWLCPECQTRRSCHGWCLQQELLDATTPFR